MIKLKIFFKKVIKLFIYITSPIFLILIIMLSPFVKIRFGLLSSHRIGEIALNMEIYLMNQLLEKKNKSKKIDLFILVDIIANQTYVDLIKKKVIIIEEILPNNESYAFTYLKKKIRDYLSNTNYCYKNNHLFTSHEFKALMKKNNFRLINKFATKNLLVATLETKLK